MIFFDIDGTLMDFKKSEYLGVKYFYNEYKNDITLDEESFYKLWCQISDKHFRSYLAGEITFSEQRIKRIKEVFSLSAVTLSDEDVNKRFAFYSKKHEESWTLFDDVTPCINELKGYRLGIISNGDLEQQSLKLEKLGIKSSFEIIVTSGEAGIAKPNIELFKIACRRANETAENCFYVGDDLNTDILPCRETGVHGIWLNRNNRKVNISKITVINTLKDLKGVLASFI